MMPAVAPRTAPDSARLLVIDPEANAFADRTIRELPSLLDAGDSVVLNDAATLPAALRAGESLELRLMSLDDDGAWLALALGPGDQRMPTEARGEPERLLVGRELSFGFGLSARIERVDPDSSRLVWLRFQAEGADLWQRLYHAASPIQYAYLSRPLALWDVQNGFSARPWAVELPSAGKALSFETLFQLVDRGVHLELLTHAAGISSTGDAQLDSRLPVAERYDLSEETAARLRATRARGARVIAVGTSVTRALEAASESGELRAGCALTRLVLGRGSPRRICDGLLTGLHEPKTSHFSLLEAFSPRALLERAARHAESAGYLQHEFGDSCLILSGALRRDCLLLEAC